MDGRFSDIVNADLDRAGKRSGISLRLPHSLERLYRHQSMEDQRRQVAINLLTGMVLFASFIVSDYIVSGDSFAIYAIGRFLICTPMCLLSTILVLRSDMYYQFALWLYPVAMTGTLSVMLSLSHGDYRIHYLFGDILILVSTSVLCRPRLAWSLAAVVTQCLFYGFVILTTNIVDQNGKVVSALFCISGAIMAVLTAYALESAGRNAFLLKLRLEVLNRELAARSLIDPLTGLGNRRMLEDATRRHWSDRRDGIALASMILIDVDFFKSFNDHHGHPAGDVCLQRIARAVAGQMRDKGDLAVRFGGEEIAVFLPDTDFATARDMAESVRLAILATAIPHPSIAPDAVVTASLGVWTSSTGESTHLELIKQSDLALYTAKRNGRNQVWPFRIGDMRPACFDVPERAIFGFAA